MQSEKLQSESTSSNTIATKNDYRYWMRFLKAMPGKQLFLSVCYGASRIAISAIWPLFLYHTLKEIGRSSNTQILMNITIVLLLLALAAVVTHFQSSTNIKILKIYTLDLIDKIWKKMNALDWLSFHGKNRVYYFDMLMVETWRLRGGAAALLESLIINSLIAGVLSLLIAFISWPLFLVCLIGMLLMGAGHYMSMRATRPLLKQFHGAWREQHLAIAKTVDQFDLIKMNRGYKAAEATNLSNATQFINSNSKLLTGQAKWRNVNQLLTNVVRIAIFIIGIFWVRMGVVGLDDLLLVLLIVSIVQSNIMQIPASMNSFLEAQEAQRTITQFFNLKEERNTNDGLTLKKHEDLSIQKIGISNLSYQYNDQFALDNVSIELERGKIYLWKGKNGSGKSTAAHIVLGLLQPEHGTLTINDQVVDWQVLSELRNRFAFLNQDSPIFMGNIKENALFGHEQPEQAWQQLQTSWLSKLLPKSAHVENKQVGERGEGLSGGEAKKIALIRELLRSSEILILDEPLNHLDESTIDAIKQEIMLLGAATIIIIISHQNGFESIADEIKEF